MPRDRGLRLTPAGMRCHNPACGVELYEELTDVYESGGECFDCDPDQFERAERRARADLFERSGGRLPARGGHCSEDCCR